jgi:putative DNA primase/helicase
MAKAQKTNTAEALLAVNQIWNGMGVVRVNFSDDLNYTEMSNAARLVQAFEDRIRYCSDQKTWYVWNGTIWQPNADGEVTELMKMVALEMYARGIRNTDLAKWGIKSQFRHNIVSSIDLAKSIPPVPVLLKEFNANSWILNFNNGTLDLKTFEFREPSSADMITKTVGYDYDPSATCPRWEQFLSEVFPGEHTEMITFLQRAVGYSLTGFTEERCLFLLHGIGANGKSKFLGGLRAMLGQYAANTDWQSFVFEDGRTRIREDIARLVGARFVSATESAQDVKLAENLIKALTGGNDPITARHLYKGSFEFLPTFKLWLATNHKPNISRDKAIWDRIRLIPFTVSFPEEKQDKHLEEKLAAEAPGIMNWALAGLKQYRATDGAGGLPTIKEIAQATADYRTDQDQVNSFLNECCEGGDKLDFVLYTLHTKSGQTGIVKNR